MMFVCRLTFTHCEPLYNVIGAKTVYSSRAPEFTLVLLNISFSV